MNNIKIHNIDLNQSGANYASFSGYIISQTDISIDQLNSLVESISAGNNLSVKTFDTEGEDLEAYCSSFDFFDLSVLEKGCFVVLDINAIEDGDTDADLTQVFLCDDDGYLLIFEPSGDISTKII